MTDFRALCQELMDEAIYLGSLPYEQDPDPDLIGRARAALEVQPEPQGPSDEELITMWATTRYIDQPEGGLAYARAVLFRWGRPAIEPVPVSERLPGPEDCDGEGRCWWFSPPARGPHTIRPCWTFDSETLEGDTHWLPHWALPVPGVEGEP
jgi:hypothetical protein